MSDTPKSGDDIEALISRVLELDAKATEGPWGYRSQEHDDWGWVRASSEPPYTVAQARAGHATNEVGLNEHRRAGTDPYGHNARLIASYRTDAPALARHLRSVLEELERVKKERDESDRALLDATSKYMYAWSEETKATIEAARKRQEESNG